MNYPPLSTSTSIRLVALEVGEGDSMVRCSLITRDLHHNPSYAALSYTWGDPQAIPYRASKPTKTIWCNDKPVLVTVNLYEALLKLRGFNLDVGGETLLLWIDGICINQNDLAERNAQVSIMGKIFAKASMVITWLGDEDENSRLAFEIMQRLMPIINLWKAERGKEFGYSYNSASLFGKVGVPMVTAEEWSAPISFFGRQYFHRCWIVQEISLARGAIVMCGYRFEEWRRLIDISAFLIESGWIPLLELFMEPCPSVGPRPTLGVPAIFSGIKFLCADLEADRAIKSSSTLNQILANKGYTFLENLLLRTRYFRATDPRDNIFAVLSIASHICESKLPEICFMRPNYLMPARDLFVHVSRDILINTKRISLLSMVDRHQCQVSSLPSWVPDFSASSTQVLASLCGGDIYNAFEDASKSCCLSMLNDVLQLDGVHLDIVMEVEAPCQPHSLQEWIRICLNMPKIYINEQSRVEALWRTLIADQDGRQSPASFELGFGFQRFVLLKAVKCVLEALEKLEGIRGDSQVVEVGCWSGYDELSRDQLDGQAQLIPTGKEIAAFVCSSLEALNEEEEGQIRSLEQGAHIFAASLSAVIGKRKLFRTARSLLGLGPASTKAGDSIWFFPTSKVPFVLRNITGSQYELIGEAYLHGYMHGELKEQDWTLQRVSLR